MADRPPFGTWLDLDDLPRAQRAQPTDLNKVRYGEGGPASRTAYGHPMVAGDAALSRHRRGSATGTGYL